MINWPVLHLSSWLKTCCNTSAYSGFFFLSGRTIDQPEEIRGMLGRFWERHLKALEFAPPFPQQTLPVYLHGDEGRGQGKRPILVISFQPVMPWFGENEVNSSKHTFTTRALYTVVPSANYAPKGGTLKELLAALRDDLNSLFETGFEASWLTFNM
ncbi:unnamed protein product [Effrenium voratum]|nr:unnamed protein product [Effrenium voratum]